jgi:hypothetical protein
MPSKGLSSAVKINFPRRQAAKHSFTVKLNKSSAQVRKERQSRYDQLAGKCQGLTVTKFLVT